MPAENGSLSHRWVREASRTVARGLAPLWLRGADRIGRSVEVRGRPYVDNKGRLTIGDGFRISSEPVRAHLVTSRRGSIVIGDDVTVATGAGVASDESGIRIGDRVHIGPFCMIWDTDYHAALDLAARSTSADVVIGEGVRLDANVTVLKGAQIGRDAWVLAGSVVSGRIEPGAVVGGVPARPVSPRHADDVDGNATGDSDVPARVARVVAATFRLPELAAAGDGEATLKPWDSLGALRLMFALEEEFPIVLPDGALRETRTLADLERLVLGLLSAPGSR